MGERKLKTMEMPTIIATWACDLSGTCQFMWLKHKTVLLLAQHSLPLVLLFWPVSAIAAAADVEDGYQLREQRTSDPVDPK